MMESRLKKERVTAAGVWSKWIAWALWAVIVSLLIIILSGIFAPRPKGERVAFEGKTRHDLNSHSQFEVSPFSEIDGLESATSIDILAQFALQERSDANAEAGIGLKTDQIHFKVTVSTSGVLTLYRDGEILSPAAPFPHIRLNGHTNELWLHLEPDGSGTIRINRELAWVGEINIDEIDPAIGALDLFENLRPTFVATARDSDVVIAIDSVALYSSSR